MVVGRKKEKARRPKTRDLIRWDDDKDIILLLSLSKHCTVNNLKVPWNDVAREIGPTVTGNAVIQHLAKMKKKRLEKGLFVPEGRLPSRSAWPPNSPPGKMAKRKVEEDEDDDFDVTGATDPDGDYEESREKRKKRPVKYGSKSVMKEGEGEDSDGDDERGTPVRKPGTKVPSMEDALKHYASFQYASFPDVLPSKSKKGAGPPMNCQTKRGTYRSKENLKDSDDESDDGKQYVGRGMKFTNFEDSDEPEAEEKSEKSVQESHAKYGGSDKGKKSKLLVLAFDKPESKIALRDMAEEADGDEAGQSGAQTITNVDGVQMPAGYHPLSYLPTTPVQPQHGGNPTTPVCSTGQNAAGYHPLSYMPSAPAQPQYGGNPTTPVRATGQNAGGSGGFPQTPQAPGAMSSGSRGRLPVRRAVWQSPLHGYNNRPIPNSHALAQFQLPVNNTGGYSTNGLGTNNYAANTSQGYGYGAELFETFDPDNWNEAVDNKENIEPPPSPEVRAQDTRRRPGSSLRHEVIMPSQHSFR